MGASALNAASPRPAKRRGQGAVARPIVAVNYRVLVSVQDGLHRGAAFIAPSAESVLLGSSPECDLILMDEGVRDRAVCFFEKDGLLAVKVLAAGACLGGEELPLGLKVFSQPLAVLRVGGAELRVELLRRSRRQSTSGRAAAAVPARRGWATVALVGLSMSTALAVVAGAVNASSSRDSQREQRTLGDVIQPFNAVGAQIAVVDDAEGRPLLRGLVADAQMREKLEREIRAAGLTADLRLHDVRQMGESLTRLARLTDHSCEARHIEGGRFECDAGVVDPQVVARLQALASQVPGAVALKVHASQPEPRPAPVPVAAAALEPPAKVEPPPPVARPRLPVIRHIAVGERESFAFDVNGRRLKVGDSVDGAKVVRIRFEAVDLLREGQRYSVAVTPMLTSAASPALN
jgi:hypothetical protein